MKYQINNKEILPTTKYIVNGGKLLNLSTLHQIKDSAKLKDLCFKIRH